MRDLGIRCTQAQWAELSEAPRCDDYSAWHLESDMKKYYNEAPGVGVGLPVSAVGPLYDAVQAGDVERAKQLAEGVEMNKDAIFAVLRSTCKRVRELKAAMKTDRRAVDKLVAVQAMLSSPHWKAIK